MMLIPGRLELNANFPVKPKIMEGGVRLSGYGPVHFLTVLSQERRRQRGALARSRSGGFRVWLHISFQLDGAPAGRNNRQTGKK
jgi:hypothetical protein